MTTAPTELAYGYVDGRLILVIGDSSDTGRMPDPVPAAGTTVQITPKQPIIRVAGADPTTVVKQSITCTLDEDGRLLDPAGARGVWLVTGVYTVTYKSSTAAIPTHDIEVTAAHTEGAPLDLTLAMPPGGPVLTPSQYAELSARIDGIVVEAGGVSSVNGATGAVVLDAADVGALPDTTPIPAEPADIGAATAAQGAKADTAVQPDDVDDVIREGDARLTDARTPTAHSHAYADITDPPTIPGPQTLSLTGSDLTLSDGGGTVTLPSGGGSAHVYPQASPPTPRIFFPPFASTGTTAVNQNVYLTRLALPYGSITEIGVEVTTSAASSVLRLGLYAPDAHGSHPSTRLVDAGTVDVSTTGWKTIVLSTPIAWTGGPIYGAVYRPSTSTTPQVRSAVNGSHPSPVFVGTSFSTTPTAGNVSNGGFYMTGNHDSGLPATFTPANQAYQPMFFGIRVV